jgi:hypothetical protein
MEKKFNKLDNIAVRTTDITEAWREQGRDYITVRFLANLLDYYRSMRRPVSVLAAAGPIRSFESTGPLPDRRGTALAALGDQSA